MMTLFLLVITSCEKSMETAASSPDKQQKVISSDVVAVNRLKADYVENPNSDRWDVYVNWIESEDINMNTPEIGRAYLSNSYSENLEVLTESGNLNSNQIEIITDFVENMNTGGLSFENALSVLNSKINTISGSSFQISILHTFADGMELVNEMNPNMFPQINYLPSPIPHISPCCRAWLGMGFSVIGGLCSAASVIGAAVSIGGVILAAGYIDTYC